VSASAGATWAATGVEGSKAAVIDNTPARKNPSLIHQNPITRRTRLSARGPLLAAVFGMSRNAAAVLVGSAIVASVIVAAQRSKALPQPYATPSVRNPPDVVRRPAGAELHLPDGFSFESWAEGFATPRFMLEASGGEVFIADSGANAESAAVGSAASHGRDGTIYVVPAGTPAGRKTLIEHLNRPYGLALWKNYLYVAEAESIKRYPYDAGKLEAGAGEEVISLAGLGRGHWTRSLLFDRRGEKLYVGIGSAENVDAGEDPRRAAINRYNPDGSGQEIFASGTRNPIGLHWYPDSDMLWAAVQERDGLGDDLPSDYLTHIQERGFYGWPYAYLGPHEDPRLKRKQPDLVQKTLTPDVALGAHVAVLDFTFYTGNQFPAEYHGGAFLAFHGSWNRSKRVGYSVAFVPFRNGRPSGDVKDFVTGWMISPESPNVWGRPVAVLELRDGSLLISDDGGNRIWRVSYAQGRSAASQ
jgi:glucose/arabinose dehydrogenase